MKVIVNLSATQLRHPEAEEAIKEALAVSELEAESLGLDVTESTFIAALESDALVLQRIEN